MAKRMHCEVCGSKEETIYFYIDHAVACKYFPHITFEDRGEKGRNLICEICLAKGARPR